MTLNPFSFPSETRARFKMLLVTALVVTWSHAAALISVPSVFTNVLSEEEQARITFDPIVHEKLPNAQIADFSFLTPVNSWKTLRLYGVRPLLACLLVSTALTLGLIIYISHPWRRRRALKSRPLTNSEAPTLVREIRDLARTCGVSKRLELEWAPGMLDGLAIGFPWRKILVYRALPMGLDRPLSDVEKAIVLHELGHLANRDIGVRELSRALWLGVIAVTFIVTVLGAFLGSAPPVFWLFFVLRVAGVCTAACLIWWGLVRTREYYADWRVVSWNMKEALLQRLSFPSNSRHKLGHPTNSSRVATLHDGHELFKISSDLPFVTGLLLAIIALYIEPLVRDLAMIYLPVMGTFFWTIHDAAGPLSPAAGLMSVLYLGVLPFFFLSVILIRLTAYISGALGVQVQREAIADLASRGAAAWRYIPMWRVAFIFALGFEVGALLAPFDGMASLRLGRLAWIVGFTCIAWIWLVYVRAASRLLLGSCVGARAPIMRRLFVGGSSAVLLAALFWPAFYVRQLVSVPVVDWPNPAGFESNQVAWAFVGLNFMMLLASAVFFYVVLVGMVVAGAALWLAVRRVSCPGCGALVRPRLTVGKYCPTCARPLSAWAYLNPGQAEV